MSFLSKLGRGKSNEAQAEKQHFQTVSREIKILTARNIAKQVQEREHLEGKLTPEAIREFTIQRSVESGWKDERIHNDIVAMVTKMYHLGVNLPDHEL